MVIPTGVFFMARPQSQGGPSSTACCVRWGHHCCDLEPPEAELPFHFDKTLSKWINKKLDESSGFNKKLKSMLKHDPTLSNFHLWQVSNSITIRTFESLLLLGQLSWCPRSAALHRVSGSMCISLNRLLVYHLDGIFTCKGDKQPNTNNEADEQVMLFHIANHRHRQPTSQISSQPRSAANILQSSTLRICSLCQGTTIVMSSHKHSCESSLAVAKFTSTFRPDRNDQSGPWYNSNDFQWLYKIAPDTIRSQEGAQSRYKLLSKKEIRCAHILQPPQPCEPEGCTRLS